jgi:uncharacterized membrane protein YfcA
MIRQLGFVLVGVLAGTGSGLVGIGGAIVIIPALVLFFGFSQQQAQGTTLAVMVPPIGLAAAWIYLRSGYVDMRAAALLCTGFLLGGFLGGLRMLLAH